MTRLTIFGIISYWWAIPSSILCVLIFRYIDRKPPGHQSVLDLLTKEYLIVCITRNITIVLVNYLGLLYGQVETTLAEIIFLVSINLGGIELAFLQALLVVKALLIFKADWLADRLESEVIWISRISAMTYSGLRFFIDFHQPTKSFHTLSLLTSTNMKS